MEEEMKKEKQLSLADKPRTSSNASIRGGAKGRGAASASRGANATVRPGPSKRGGAVPQGGGNAKTGTTRRSVGGVSSNSSGPAHVTRYKM